MGRRTWVLLALAVSGCGRGAVESAGAPVSVSPASVNLPPGAPQRFSASAEVTWSLPENAGSITETGEYIAPATPGTYHVMATSKVDRGQTAIATVTVSVAPVVSVSVDPAGASLAPGATATFTASVRGTRDLGASWSVQESGGGSVHDGVYTAPAAPGLYHVMAASHADPTKTASAAVLVTAPSPLVSVRIDPATAMLRAGDTTRFNAIVTGAVDGSATWTAPDGGTVSSTGLFLAPVALGDYRVVATSRADPSKAATAVAHVQLEPLIAVSVSPAAFMVAGGSLQQLVATVTGTADTRVAWSADAGTVDDTGHYLSPSAPGTYHIFARSVADSTKVASAVCTVSRPEQVTLIVSPDSPAPVVTGSQLQFTAIVTGLSDTRVLWSVDGGAIDANGLYTAPQTAGRYLVMAESASAHNGRGVYITVFAPGTVVVTPDRVVIPPATSVQMRAFVAGIADQRVTWSVGDPGGGSVDGRGLYTTPRLEGTFRVIATSMADPSQSAAATVKSSWGNLEDFGGQVVSNANVVALWWGDRNAFPADARTSMEALLAGLNGTSYLAIVDQYMRGKKAKLSFAGSLQVSSAPPDQEVTDADLAAVVCAALDAQGAAPDPNTAYMVYAANFPGAAHATFCGWHSWGTCHGIGILTAYLPNLALLQSCNWPAPPVCDGGDVVTQSLATVTAHELIEILTDPTASSWYDPDNGHIDEVGDKCAWLFQGCTEAGGRSWQLQPMWSNATHNCVTQP
jgi:hypothetical protein